jgi:phage recombination protein Bet
MAARASTLGGVNVSPSTPVLETNTLCINGSRASRYDQAEIVACIKQTVAKGASDAQLRMFLEVCRSTGLDPFLKEIYFVAEKAIIMASRDGYLRVANEHPQFDGMETHVERDKNMVPIKATCSVWRKDRRHAIICEAYYNEYKKAGPVWTQYPSAMISKVAEVLALKRSFAINGVVTEEEMGQQEPRGSAAAAQEVARTKIAEMQARQKPQPAAELAAQLPDADEGEYTYEEEVPLDSEERSQLEAELAQSLAAERAKRLAAFAELERRYAFVGFPQTYGGMLGQFGARNAADFPETEEGLQDARACYQAMKTDLAKREARARR